MSELKQDEQLTGRNSCWVKCLSVLLSLFFLVILSELLFVAYYYLRDGEYIPTDKKISQTLPRYIYKKHTGSCKSNKQFVSHPYLAFTRKLKPECKQAGEELTAHNGSVFARGRDAEKFTVMITGSSTAVQLMEKHKPSIAELLSKYHYQGRPVEVVNGAVGEWKQPQQFIMTMLHIQDVDAVFTLEGYNEIRLHHHTDFKYAMDVPLLNSYRRTNPQLFSHKQIAYMWSTYHLFTWVQKNMLLNKSKMVFFLLEYAKNRTRTVLNTVDENNQITHIDDMFLLPSDWDLDQRKKHFYQRYTQYIRDINQLAKAHQVKFAYFLQPVPALHKELTKEEVKRVGRVSYAEDYLEMERMLLALRSEKISITSLTDLFAGINQSIYKDFVHFDPETSAAEILNEKIITTLVEQWQLELISE